MTFRITTNGIDFRLEVQVEKKWVPIDQPECYRGAVKCRHATIEAASHAKAQLEQHLDTLWEYKPVEPTKSLAMETTINTVTLSPAEIDTLNRVIGTIIKQVDDFAYLDNHPRVPDFDSRSLCRLRMKIAPHIGITDTVQSL